MNTIQYTKTITVQSNSHTLFEWLPIIIALAAILVSIATLALGYLAYQKFLVNQAAQKQLDIVLDLVETMHSYKNTFMQFRDGNLLTSHSGSILEFIGYNIFDKGTNLFFIESSVLQSYQHEILYWDFYWRFHENPLLPSSISRELKKFNPVVLRHRIPKEEIRQKGGVILGNRKYEDIERACYVMSGPMRTMGEFQKAAKDLKEAITDWLKLHGIRDINLMDGPL